MVIKHAIIIAIVTGAIITGAIIGIVGGAVTISGVAVGLHYIMDNGPKGHNL